MDSSLGTMTRSRGSRSARDSMEPTMVDPFGAHDGDQPNIACVVVMILCRVVSISLYGIENCLPVLLCFSQGRTNAEGWQRL